MAGGGRWRCSAARLTRGWCWRRGEECRRWKNATCGCRCDGNGCEWRDGGEVGGGGVAGGLVVGGVAVVCGGDVRGCAWRSNNGGCGRVVKWVLKEKA